jgi:hypothetical protein
VYFCLLISDCFHRSRLAQNKIHADSRFEVPYNVARRWQGSRSTKKSTKILRDERLRLAVQTQALPFRTPLDTVSSCVAAVDAFIDWETEVKYTLREGARSSWICKAASNLFEHVSS